MNSPNIPPDKRPRLVSCVKNSSDSRYISTLKFLYESLVNLSAVLSNHLAHEDSERFEHGLKDRIIRLYSNHLRLHLVP